jgi:hypothetical protein
MANVRRADCLPESIRNSQIRDAARRRTANLRYAGIDAIRQSLLRLMADRNLRDSHAITPDCGGKRRSRGADASETRFNVAPDVQHPD